MASSAKNHVKRGYGASRSGGALECAGDRATLWAVGKLARERGHRFALPLPIAMSGKAQPHEIAATVAWFAPPKLGTIRYRGARLKLIEPDEIAALGVAAAREQPDTNQVHRGTVIHRRWSGAKAAALVEDQTLKLVVQREPDEHDEDISYALTVTIAMAGVVEIYEQVRTKVAVKPKVRIAV